MLDIKIERDEELKEYKHVGMCSWLYRLKFFTFRDLNTVSITIEK